MDILLQHFLSHYGYYAVFVFVFLGGTYVPIPSGIALIAVGALSHHHQYFHFWLAFIVSLAASLTDDLVTYGIARKIGAKESYARFIANNRFAKRIEDFAKKRPMLAILCSRFIGVAGMPVNALAGLSQLPIRTFVFFCALGESVCIFGYLIVGYYIGTAWQDDAREAAKVISSIFLLATLLYIAIFFLLKLRKDRKAQRPG